MAKKDKATNNSTPKEKLTNLSRSKAPDITPSQLEFFCHEMVIWAQQNEEALDPMEYVMAHGVKPDTYWNWRDKYEIVADADSAAREYIGFKRDKKWLKGEHVSGADKYLPAFKSLYRRHIEAAKQYDAVVAKEKITHQAREASKLAQETGFYLPPIREDNE